MQKTIEEHPALRWKAINLRKHRGLPSWESNARSPSDAASRRPPQLLLEMVSDSHGLPRRRVRAMRMARASASTRGT
jgi:hypothetical protein